MQLPPFQKLLDAHGAEVHRFLTALVGHPGADDCYQDTWLAALRAYPRLRDAANLRSWLFTIAHRKAIDHGRRRARVISVADVPDRAAPATATTDEELWSRVRELPPKQRTAIALRYIADADYRAISAVTGTSQEAARRNVYEGLQRLRKEYTP